MHAWNACIQRQLTNIFQIFGLLTPDPTLAHLNTSIACRGFHREASGHPRTNPKLNIGGVRGNGVSNVTGILAGMRVVGTLKRFHVDIASVTFLGPALPAYTTQGEYPDSRPTTQTVLLPTAMTPTPKGRRKAGISFDDKPIPTKKSRT